MRACVRAEKCVLVMLLYTEPFSMEKTFISEAEKDDSKSSAGLSFNGIWRVS
jgi:hypothetical protein